MSTWRDVGRHLADPEVIARWVSLAIATTAAVGLARTLGVSVHPAVGWAALLACAGAPAAWLTRRWLDDRTRARAAEARARHRDGDADVGALLGDDQATRRPPGGPERFHPDATTAAPRPGWTD